MSIQPQKLEILEAKNKIKRNEKKVHFCSRLSLIRVFFEFCFCLKYVQVLQYINKHVGFDSFVYSCIYGCGMLGLVNINKFDIFDCFLCLLISNRRNRFSEV